VAARTPRGRRAPGQAAQGAQGAIVSVMRFLHDFLSDERGLETVEYSIIAGLIVSGLVAIVVAISQWTRGHLGGLMRSLYDD